MVGVLKKIYNLLTSNGVFLMGMIEGNYHGFVERESMPGVKRYFKFYKRKELAKIVENVGLKFVYQETYKSHNIYTLTRFIRRYNCIQSNFRVSLKSITISNV